LRVSGDDLAEAGVLGYGEELPHVIAPLRRVHRGQVAAGKDAFLDLSLPQAILKLRQGVGRLIRTKDDRGAVILTDQRILQKGYGKLFTAALPVAGRKVGNLDELLCDLGTWFTGRSR
jgi:Rad3-related DNA helicase